MTLRQEDIIKEGFNMNMQEITRLIKALRAAGWTGDEITDLLIYLESGNEEYKPKKKE